MTSRDQIAAALRRSVKENQRLLAENAALRAQSTEPIAVVSMACRLPGGVRTPEDMWRILYDGRDAVSPLPEDRGWDLDGMYDPVPGRPGRCYTRRGGFLDCVAEFDPAFFGISPREALAIDPVQRLLLETAWETLERARVDPQQLCNSRTGVFTGVVDSFYYPGMDRTPAELAGYATLGNVACVASGRISYLLGLQGPPVTLETACSSSLTAIHLARRALHASECDLALAAGGAVMAAPETLVEFSFQQGLAADGRCKPFSASADGTVLGEGIGMVLLARKSYAERMGYPILAVIRGSAINSDGASNGLTAPNGTAQREVIRAALADASLSPAEVDVVEAHGTGTKLGDPIEADALLDTYGQDRAGGQPLLVGSLKSNFGHPQAAAGVAGVIKMVLAMRAGWLPATLHFDGPSPYIDWSAGAVHVLGEARAWPEVARPRRAGVSSFGISGTNVHLILEQVPEEAPRTAGRPVPGPLPFALSAKTSAALRAQAAVLRTHLDEHDSRLSDVAFSLATTRTQFDRRAVVTANTREELCAGLNAIVDDLPHASVATGTVQDTVEGAALAFVFAGQGTQRAGMGAELYERYPVFATALDQICTELDQHLEQPLRKVMFGTDSDSKALLDCTRFVQPALFAFEAALYALLRSWDVRPTVLVGHSIGELTAAYVAGVWTLPDAAALVAARGRLMGELPRRGAMAALQADDQQVLAALGQLGGRVELAAVNGPSSVVVAGDEADVHRLVEQWKTVGRKASTLNVSHAFHSAHLDPILAEFDAVVASIEHRAPQIRIVSCLEPDADLTQPTHWVRQARETVRFFDGVRVAHELGAMTFVDLGPDGRTAALAGDCLNGKRGVSVIPAVRADGSEAWAVQTALARIHARGGDLDWDAVFASEQPQRVALPTYAFQRQRYWWHAATKRPSTAGTEPAVDDSGDQLQEPMSLPRLESMLKHNLAAVTGITDMESMEPTTTFRDLGLTSVGVVELRQRLEASTGLSLPSTFAFDYPTPATLLEHLSTLVPQDVVVASAPRQARSTPRQRDEDHAIAIVGMACRYPGGVTRPDELWNLVANGVDAISSFPDNRGWPHDIYDPDPDHRGTSYTREGGFLDDVAGFDPAFFGISDHEAQAMDPQQRLLLETAWEAFEDAGVDPASARGTATGVFIGIAMQDYQPQADELAPYRGIGQAPSVASGRIAYVLGTQGPALTVDTACSSSLVALHMATQSLRSQESSLALVGGATVLTTPEAFVTFSRQRGLAPDGRCKAFGAGADGTGWAEGVGMLLLERVCDARRLGHRVLAVVRGSAVNSDGASNGLTAPNGLAQQRVIRAALTYAGLRAEDVDLIEAHGTGTALGDPVEAGALLATYGAQRSLKQPVWVGSLKSNIGHSMAAAGVGGVIKVVQSMCNGRMPKTLHADPASPHVDWSAGAVRLLTEAQPWPEPRRAAVSGFGVSGTNAHVIIEYVAPNARSNNDVPSPALVGVPISGHSQDALMAQARRLRNHVTTRPDLTVAEIGWSAATTRCALRYRAVVIASTRAELVEGLSALMDDVSDPRVVTARARSVHPMFVTMGPEPYDDLIKVWRECGVTGPAVVADPGQEPTVTEVMRELLAQRHHPVIQLGGDPALTDEFRHVIDTVAKQTALIVSPAVEEFAQRDFLHALAQAHVHGVALDWRYIFGDGIRQVELPTYAFQRSRYWAPPTTSNSKSSHKPGVGDSYQTTPIAGMAATEAPQQVMASTPDTITPVREGREHLLDRVVELLAPLLDLPAGDIDHDEGFFQLGMDSLAAVELRKQLEGTVGMELPGTLLFEQPNVTALVDWLVNALNTPDTPAPTVAAVSPMRDLGPAGPLRQDISDKDLVALLDAEIERSRTTRERVAK
jgi:rifamycin polyketide synthase module 1/2/3